MLVPSGIHAKYPIPRNAESLRNPRFSRTFTSKITHSIPRRPQKKLLAELCMTAESSRCGCRQRRIDKDCPRGPCLHPTEADIRRPRRWFGYDPNCDIGQHLMLQLRRRL